MTTLYLNVKYIETGSRYLHNDTKIKLDVLQIIMRKNKNVNQEKNN